jgi:hypothetical protein
MALEGKDARDFHNELKRRNAELATQWLADAKNEAIGRGKELFDIKKLKTLVDPYKFSDEKLENWYYVEEPQLMTLLEFTESIKQNLWWDHG